MISLRKRLFLIFLSASFCTIFISLKISAQETPKIILPSPEASTLFRFQQYRVDHSTGLPNISVPLYVVKSGSLSVPIDLSYHASGRRVYDQDGPVALGWTLNAGGSISRTVNGSADFGQYPFPYPFTLSNLTNASHYTLFEQIKHYNRNNPASQVSTWKDSEYDLFSYYFGGQSGKFVFKDSNGAKTASLLPYKPYIVTPTYTTSSLNGVNIVDDKGVTYKFNVTGTYTDNTAFAVNNQFDLTSIISSDKADTITFVYGKPFNQTRVTISQTITLNDAYTGANANAAPTELTETESTNTDYYTLTRLTEINFRNGKVIFDLVTNSDKVDGIRILNKQNVLIKSIKLNRSALDASPEISNYTNKLDSVVFKDENNKSVELYGFEYYPTYSANVNVRYRDWWGYYNGFGDNRMIPQYTVEKSTQGSINFDYKIGNLNAKRTPNLSALESGVLRKVTYPTKGSTEFIYENNRYKDILTQQEKYGPGLRIAEIKNSDRNGTISYKTYRYGDNELGSGAIDMVPEISNMAAETNYYYHPTSSDPSPYGFGIASYRQRVFFSDFIPQLKEIADRPVVYSSVTEYQGRVDDNIGKIVYTYDYSSWAPSALQTRSLTIPRYHIYNYNYWNNPSLRKQTEYKNISNHAIPYAVRKEISNSYENITTEYISGLHVEPINIFPQQGYVQDPTPPQMYPEPWSVLRGASPMNSPYGYGEYRMPVGYKNLISSSETVYNPDGTSTMTATSYTYNSRQYVSTSTMQDSQGENFKTQITYPFDYTGNAVLTQMNSVSLNMLDFPIETQQFKNSVLLNGTRTNYANWGSPSVPRIYPISVDTKMGTMAYETRVTMHGYDDRGNLVSASKDNGIKENYIWSYQKVYPVAKIDNVDYNSIVSLLGGDVELNKFANSNPTEATFNTFLAPLRISSTMKDAFITTFTYIPLVGMSSKIDPRENKTSFEFDDYQRLKNVKNRDNNILKTYNYNYATTGGVPTKYFNNYLSKSYVKGNCVAGEGSSVTYRVPANKYSSTISQADADSKAQVDMDANGQNYANANGICFFSNVYIEQTFTRNNCEVGVNGSQVKYSVPAGKYVSTISQADANAKATAEITAMGQTNANENGACGFYNNGKSGFFTKNNCPAGALPFQMSYEVPAKKYYSPTSQAVVDAQEQADIDANGQNYVNSVSSCPESVTMSFSNSVSESLGITFTRIDGGYQKSYVAPPGNSTLILPGGVYTVTAQVIGSSAQRRIYVGSRSAILGNYVTFSNVNVANGTGSQMEHTMGMY